MSVQVYAGGRRIYDSRIPIEQQMPLLSAHIKEGLNKGGTASIVLPPLHPAVDAFTAYAVPVEIYRNGALRWRGRPLPGSSDVYGRRTITCEGELCFLQDSSCRPYTYTANPEWIFTTLIGIHNAAVEPWKRFEIGIVSVKSTAEVTLSAKEPEQVFSAVSKLRQMCGGFILFDTALSGARRINWFEELPYLCKQKIKLGYNLTNYSTRPDTASFATRIIPYGDYGEDGKRIKINLNGKDYVEDPEAVVLHGVVEKSVIYNGATNPADLEALAWADLAKAVSMPETISLTAVDMSRIDASIDGFALGQRVEAESAPHNLSGRYDLVELEEDLIQPTVGAVTVTRDAATYVPLSGTLTGVLHQQAQQIQQKPSQSAIDRAVAEGTAWLTNGQGYKVERRDDDGNTIDTLYMDIPDINTAVNVLRIGQSGIGFSKSGVNGPYVYAWTIDGTFNADFLIGLLIKACRIESLNGKIAIDLSDETKMPVFNTGISTNGLTVRGDAADAAELFTLKAIKAASGYFGKMLFKSVDGTDLFQLSESFTDGELSGIVAQFFARAGLSAVISTSENKAGFWLRHDGIYKGHMTIDSDGVSATNTARLNGKDISWVSNGDGTYHIVGTTPT